MYLSNMFLYKCIKISSAPSKPLFLWNLLLHACLALKLCNCSCVENRQTHCSCRLHFILEKLLGSKLEDVIQLLFGHGACFRAQAGPHHQVSQHHFSLCYLGDSFLHRAPSHKAVDHHFLVLADAVGSAESLREQKDAIKKIREW